MHPYSFDTFLSPFFFNLMVDCHTEGKKNNSPNEREKHESMI